MRSIAFGWDSGWVTADSAPRIQTEWLSLPELVEVLGEPLGRVRRLLDESQLIGSRRDGALKVPAVFIMDGRPLVVAAGHGHRAARRRLHRRRGDRLAAHDGGLDRHARRSRRCARAARAKCAASRRASPDAAAAARRVGSGDADRRRAREVAQLADRGVAEARARERAVGLARVVGDERLDAVERAGVDDRALQRGDLVVVERRGRRSARRRSGAPDGASASRAYATSTVRLPSRRSSPDGLPVSRSSPKTPSTSSRSWNAIPSGCPNAASAAACGEVGAGERRADRERLLHAVAGGLERCDAQRARRRAARRARCGTPTPRRCRGTGRSSPRAASWRTPSRAAAACAADAAASPSSRRSSLHATSRSPSRMADERPKAAASPTQPVERCAPSSARCAAGRPRRVSELSITSSCTSAAAWKTSSAAAAVMTASGASLGGPRRLGDGPPAGDAEAPAQALSAGRRAAAADSIEQARFGAEIGGRGALSRRRRCPVAGKSLRPGRGRLTRA